MDWVQVGNNEGLGKLVSAARARTLALAAGAAQTHVLHAVADELGPSSLVVHVPDGLDAALLVPLLVADQCGAGVLREAEAAVLTHGPAGAFGVLEPRLEGRHLFVDRLDRLRCPSTGWDLSSVHADELHSLHDWLGGHASATTGAGTRRVDVTARQDPRLDTSHLWDLTERDPDRFALAVARTLLRGSSDSVRGWDDEALMADLWEDMPSVHRTLVGLLAVHGRPIGRALFERLGLVPPDVLARAHELALIELNGGWLTVPKPWYSGSPGFDARSIHRTLADAFARAATDGVESANGICVLEAHRHYAAIPDTERALAFASYGASALLEAAFRQSRSGNWPEAANMYGAYLELDRREPSSPGPLQKSRTRAYATHYLHFNRARTKAEPLFETLAGYREAIAGWPENALFWHRLVRASFEAGEEDAAMAALRQARESVPAHPERERTLVIRTVDRLLQSRHVLGAVFVWGEHEPTSDADRLVRDELFGELEKGTATSRLWADGVPGIDLDTPVEVRAMRISADAWECRVAGYRRVDTTVCASVRAAVRAAVLNELADRWRRETGGLSIVARRVEHPAWKQILAMGKEVVPELLRRAERTPDHWHTALTALTGDNPIPSGAKVTVTQVCAAWADWGRKRGLIE